MQLQQNQEAFTMNGSSRSEQREHSRAQLPIRALAIFPQTGGIAQTALLHDINMLGALFYCNESPHVDEPVILEFSIGEAGNKTGITCEGVVARVDEPTSGFAIGVAMRFTHYELRTQWHRLRYTTEPGDTPFINWTVDMVERMFRKKRTN